jgi:(4S)-4-hydroxy-5-phosphonooxypentane-2,3-dione isomerase
MIAAVERILVAFAVRVNAQITLIFEPQPVVRVAWRDLMSDLVLVVTVKVKPGYVDVLKPAMLENAAQSVKEETCYQFDVIVSRDDENTFIFYEVYKDERALAAHRKTPHFLSYWKLMQELGDKVERSAQLYDKLS